MADRAVMEILKRIQASIVALDEKFTRQYTMLSQDVRLIRAGIQDMVRTRVTAGEVDVLRPDCSWAWLSLRSGWTHWSTPRSEVR